MISFLLLLVGQWKKLILVFSSTLELDSHTNWVVLGLTICLFHAFFVPILFLVGCCQTKNLFWQFFNSTLQLYLHWLIFNGRRRSACFSFIVFFINWVWPKLKTCCRTFEVRFHRRKAVFDTPVRISVTIVSNRILRCVLFCFGIHPCFWVFNGRMV